MHIDQDSTTTALFIHIDGPDGWVPSSVSAEVALVGEGDRPAADDWHAGTWQDCAQCGGPDIRYLVPVSSTLAGDYVAKARLTVAPEQVVLTAGRVTVG